jgi:hypothetical protein
MTACHYKRIHDLSGKTLVPFITHGGYGLGQSLSVVAEHAPHARILEPFSKRAGQLRLQTRDRHRDKVVRDANGMG